MVALFKLFLGWLTGGPLDRILDSVDRKVDATTDRDRIKADLTAQYLSAQVAVLTGRGWWFPLFFIVPAGFWFASVCIYSVLWCRACAFPQAWTIAALPAPLDEWMGGIVASLFIAKGAGALVAGWRGK